MITRERQRDRECVKMPAATTSVKELQEAAKESYKKGNNGKVPVTVLTGFLGAVRFGKERERERERDCVRVCVLDKGVSAREDGMRENERMLISCNLIHPVPSVRVHLRPSLSSFLLFPTSS